jgi:hypothetical protein
MTWICGRCYTQLVGDAAGVCPSCGSEDVIPAESPRGQQLAAGVALPGPSGAGAIVVPRPPPGAVVCPTCYSVGPPMTTGPSSAAQLVLVMLTIAAFVAFWPVGLFLLLIVVVYSLTPTKNLCRGCGNVGVVPGDSQRALEILSGRR